MALTARCCYPSATLASMPVLLVLSMTSIVAESCVITKEIGCFKDSDPTCAKADCRGPRLLIHSAIKSDAQLTRARCAEACCADGYGGGFVGVEFGDECYCSHDLNISAATAEPSSACAQMKCPGNESEDCGSSYRISVFRASCATPCQGPPRPPSPPPSTNMVSCWASASISTQKYCNPKLSASERVADLLPRLTQDEKINRLQWSAHSPAIERLGIPAMWHQECQHGLWNGAGAGGGDPTGCMTVHPPNSTGCPSSFPVLAALGATFNKSAVRLVATAISDEGRVLNNVANGSDGKSKALGALTCWSPNTNLIKDPRWGRGGTETFSEDAFHTSEMVTEYVKGLQGDHPTIRKLSATCKHTFGYQQENWQPTGDYRQWPDARAASHNNISAQDMARYYLKPFEACIKAGTAGMMCSYNEVNGRPTCTNSDVNNKHYRETLKWDGFMVSDCGAISDIASPHHYAPNQTAGAADAINGGCDAACDSDYSKLSQALQVGLISTRTLDTATSRLLKEQIHQGELDDPATHPYKSTSSGYHNHALVDSRAHRDLALQTASQAMVLLENDYVGGSRLLPLRKGLKSLAILGPHANTSLGLLGNYFGGNSLVFEQTPLLSVRRSSVAQKVMYEPGVPCFNVTHSGSRKDPYPLCVTTDTPIHTHISAAVAAAKEAEMAVLFLGIAAVNNSGPCNQMAGVEGEGCDRASIALPAVQEKLLRAVMGVQPRTVVVLINGGAVAMPEDMHIPALVEAFYAGERGGDAIVTALWHLSPRIFGRMPYIVPRINFTTERNFLDMSMTGGCGITHQYYKRKPQYDFGYGLTYSNFTYERHKTTPAVLTVTRGNLTTRPDHVPLSFACVVTNTGAVDADAVVLAFVRPPVVDGQPKKRLIGFERVPLRPQEGTVVAVGLGVEALSLVDEFGGVVPAHEGERWSVEVGDVVRPARAEVFVVT